MLDKPSRDEDEYFAREDVEKRKLAFQQSEVMAEQQKEALRTLHYMKCPKCGFDLHPEARGRGPRHVLQLQGPVGRRRRVSPPSSSSGGAREAGHGHERAPENLQERLTMSLTLEEVRHVASLARLSLSAEEETLMRTQLSAILDAVAELHRTWTPPPWSPPRTPRGRWPRSGRTRVRPSFPPEKALGNAPAEVGASFAVPRIIE